MGFLDRLRDRYSKGSLRDVVNVPAEPRRAESGFARPHDFLEEGEVVIHAVGESNHQQELARMRGRQQTFLQTWALLMAEPDNPYDKNAVSIAVNGVTVGYLCREDAALFQPAVLDMAQRSGQPPKVKAAIVGGGGSRLGVQLILDPLQFGIGKKQLTMIDPRGFGPDSPRLRLREARRAIDQARSALDRHYAYLQLEESLYRLREEAGNLAEFEEVCERHHAAMSEFGPALLREFGTLPLLKHYKQMAIAKDKAKDYEAALGWCRRGLAVYESAPHDPSHVEDLRKRVARLESKLTKQRDG
jgi:hypothetical protein